MNKYIKGYKAFGKGFICQDKQYEIGKTYVEMGTKMCEKGLMHFCKKPFDVFNYYPLIDNKGNITEFARVKSLATETMEEEDKCGSRELTIIDKITLKDLIGDEVKTLLKLCKNATTGYGAHSATTGNLAHSATTGVGAHSATTGYGAHSVTTGDWAHSVTTGDWAHSVTTGDWAHSVTTGDWARSATTGNEAHSVTTGDWAHSVTTGDWAHSATTGYGAHSVTTGKNAIACALGNGSKAKASKGAWIVLTEYDKNGNILSVQTIKVDDDKIKANTYYTLKNGQFVIAE